MADYQIGDLIEVTQLGYFGGDEKVIRTEPVVRVTKTLVITESHRFKQDHSGVLYQTNGAQGMWQRWLYQGRKVS